MHNSGTVKIVWNTVYSTYGYSCQIKHGKFWIITKSLIVNRLFLQPMSDEPDNGFEDDFDDDVEDEEDEETEDD